MLLGITALGQFALGMIGLEIVLYPTLSRPLGNITNINRKQGRRADDVVLWGDGSELLWNDSTEALWDE
jgi:hypothetical protein